MTQLERLRPFGPDWGALGALRREFDDLFERFGSAPMRSVYTAYPAVNLYETDEAYMLVAELPGLAPEDVSISLEGSTVTLAGERKAEPEDGASVHRRERPSGAFRRAFDLPVAIDGERVEAVHRNGVLTLRLPKAPEHRPRQITVKAG